MFYLFSTSGCHLCEQARELLVELEAELRSEQVCWSFDIVDIADDEALFKAYGARIPVLFVAGDKADLGWPFELVDVKAYVLNNL